MKCEILKDFIDKYNPSLLYTKGDIVEFSKERIDEIKDKEKEINEKLIKKVNTKRVVE